MVDTEGSFLDLFLPLCRRGLSTRSIVFFIRRVSCRRIELLVVFRVVRYIHYAGEGVLCYYWFESYRVRLWIVATCQMKMKGKRRSLPPKLLDVKNLLSDLYHVFSGMCRLS